VGLYDRRVIGAALGEEIAAEEELARLVEDEAAIPAVRQMWGVVPGEARAADIERLAIGKRARRLIGDIADRDHGADASAQGLGIGGDAQELIQGAALIGLVVRKADPAQALGREDLGDGAARRFEEAARAGVPEHRLVGGDEILVEGKAAAGAWDGDIGGDAENLRCDFVDACGHDESPRSASIEALSTQSAD